MYQSQHNLIYFWVVQTLPKLGFMWKKLNPNQIFTSYVGLTCTWLMGTFNFISMAFIKKLFLELSHPFQNCSINHIRVREKCITHKLILEVCCVFWGRNKAGNHKLQLLEWLWSAVCHASRELWDTKWISESSFKPAPFKVVKSKLCWVESMLLIWIFYMANIKPPQERHQPLSASSCKLPPPVATMPISSLSLVSKTSTHMLNTRFAIVKRCKITPTSNGRICKSSPKTLGVLSFPVD